jgi:hypothetical protein
LDTRYLAIDCLDKHLHHPLNGICKFRGSNFTVCQLTGQARSNLEWPGLGTDVVTEGKTAAFPRKADNGHFHHRAVSKKENPRQFPAGGYLF